MSSGMMHGRRQHRRGGSDPMNGPRGFPGETGWPAFENSWGNTGGGRAPASFAIVDDVLVIQGSVTGGVSGTVVFTLPVGYRPDASYTEPGALTIDDELASVTVDTDGTVTIATLTTGAYMPGGGDVAVADGGTGASTASGARTNLGLVIGTDIQAQDAELAAVAGLTSVADRVPYFTGSGTAALATFTAAGRALVDDANAAAQLVTLGAAAAAHGHAGEDITSGTIADARIASTIARDSEIPAFATPAVVLGTAAAAGAASTVIRSDATVLAFDVTAPSTQAFGDAAAVGVAAVAARRDHKHAMPADPATAAVILLPTTSARNTIQPSGAAIIPLTVKGFASQSADLQQWQSSTGNIVLAVKNSGSIRMSYPGYSDFDILNEAGVLKIVADFRFVGYGFYGGGNPGAGIALGVKSPAATDITLVLRGFTSQSADLQQWQDSGSNILASVTAAGIHKWEAANAQTTVGAAGAASALPATPTKYLKVVDSAGTVLVIPAYAAA